ncbi:MAG TPA: CsgG/HfaB family protein [Tepidisphaeraceae bacterium]
MAVTAVVLGGLMGGCSSSSETATADTLTANVGKYDAPPAGAVKPNVGVPPFNVQVGKGFSGGQDLNDLAADQMTTLLDMSERFTVIERTQMQKLLDEQNLEGIVRPGELAKTGQVRGVDYLLLGKVTNLRLKDESTEKGFGLAQVGGLLSIGGGDYKKKERSITAECGVDIRLVDPTDGKIMMTSFSEFKRTDSTSAMGIDILGASAEANAEISISEDDKGKILRLALDDALRKSLPKIDKVLKAAGTKQGGAAPKAMSAASQAPVTPAAAPIPAEAAGLLPSEKGDRSETNPAEIVGKKFCSNCGTEVAGGAKFCPKDGTKIE